MKNLLVLLTGTLLLAGCASHRTAVRTNSLTKEISRQPGLIALWDCGDSSGNIVAGRARNLRLTAKGANKRLNEGPLSGSSIQLDGKSDYWIIPNLQSAALDLQKVTIIAWVKWSGGTGFVAGKWNEYADGGKRQYGLFVSLPYYNGANQVCGHISRNGGPTAPFPYSIDYSASPQQVSTDEWACVTFSYDGQYIRSYYNGVFQKREAELIQRTAGFLPSQPEGIRQIKNPYFYPDGIGNNGSDFTVGAVQLKQGMGNFFKGAIGGIAVFDRALSDDLILHLSGKN